MGISRGSCIHGNHIYASWGCDQCVGAWHDVCSHCRGGVSAGEATEEHVKVRRWEVHVGVLVMEHVEVRRWEVHVGVLVMIVRGKEKDGWISYGTIVHWDLAVGVFSMPQSICETHSPSVKKSYSISRYTAPSSY